MEKVTVVLPIYNVEKYLDRCINTIVNQTYKNLEIILVDDGSPDNCPFLCDNWEKKDKRVKVIHKKNAGLGYARNSGLEIASGNYICFFDSDDYIALDAIEKMMKCAKEHNADIVTFGFANVNSNGDVISTRIPHVQKSEFKNKEVINSFLPDLISSNPPKSDNSNLMMSAWASFYKTSLLKENNWKFVSEREIISEDVYSLLELYKYVRCVAVLEEALYYYCENGTSLTKTFREDRFQKINVFYEKCLELCTSNKNDQKIIKRLQYTYISYVIAALKMVAESNNVNKNMIFREIINNQQFIDVISCISLEDEPFKRKALLFVLKKKLSKIAMLLFTMNR